MKKASLFIAALTAAVTSFAQDAKSVKSSHVYVRLGATYALPFGGQTTIDQSQFLNGSSKTTTTTSGTGSSITSFSWDVKKASLGAGIHATLAAGYMTSKNFGIELAATAGFAPKKYTYKNEATYPYGGVTAHSSYKGTFYQKMPVLLMPAIVIQTGGSKINVYSRLGLALPVAGKQIWEFEEYAFISTGSVLYKYDYEVKNRLAVGMQGALGAQFSVGDKIRFYVEVNGVSLNAYAKKATMTKYTVDGVDRLEYVSTYSKEIDYDNTGTQNNVVANLAVPQQAATFSTSYSNIGIGGGLLIQF